MSAVIIDNRMPNKCKDALRALGFELIELPCFSSLPSPVSAHPDMLLFFADKTVFTHKDYRQTAKKELDRICDLGYDILLSGEKIAPEYPNDILFNALRVGKTIYCKESAVSSLIKDFAIEKGLRLADTRQGYAKCSVCSLSESAAITADPSLARSLERDGTCVLKIRAGGIILSGYDTGFIGGCSGVFGDTVYFSGNIALHPDGEKIIDFCESHKKRVVSLSDEPLFDVGTMFFI